MLWVCCVLALWYDRSESTTEGGRAVADLDLALDWDRIDCADEFVGTGAGRVADLFAWDVLPRALELPLPSVVEIGGDGEGAASTSIQS